MGIWNKETIEKEGLSLAEKAGEAVLTHLTETKTSGSGITTGGGGFSGGLVGLIVEAVTTHVLANGSAPDLALLKTSIGQLIEGTVGVLQATGKISAPQAAKVEAVVAQATPIPASVVLPSLLVAPTPPKLQPPSMG